MEEAATFVSVDSSRTCHLELFQAQLTSISGECPLTGVTVVTAKIAISTRVMDDWQYEPSDSLQAPSTSRVFTSKGRCLSQSQH